MRKHIPAYAGRVCVYGLGVILLALGLTLNVKARLGAAPVLTVPLTISEIWNVEYTAAVFGMYTVFVLGQIGLRRKWEWETVLQIPFSAVFSFLLKQFGKMLPIEPVWLWERLLILAVSMTVTALGIGMMVDMRLLSNPADGLARALGEKLRRGTGAGKNIVDLSCVAVSCAVGLLADGTVHQVGAGTLISMITVGRILALFNSCFKNRLEGFAGLR